MLPSMKMCVLFVIALLAGVDASPESEFKIDGKYINLSNFEKWQAEIESGRRKRPKERVVPRHVFAIRLGDRFVSSNELYLFIGDLVDSISKEGKSKDFAYEMAQWIQAESVSRRIAAGVAIEKMFPEISKKYTESEVGMTEKTRLAIANEILLRLGDRNKKVNNLSSH